MIARTTAAVSSPELLGRTPVRESNLVVRQIKKPGLSARDFF